MMLSNQEKIKFNLREVVCLGPCDGLHSYCFITDLTTILKRNACLFSVIYLPIFHCFGRNSSGVVQRWAAVGQKCKKKTKQKKHVMLKQCLLCFLTFKIHIIN